MTPERRRAVWAIYGMCGLSFLMSSLLSQFVSFVWHLTPEYYVFLQACAYSM
jgi:hypothetical protein